MAIAKSATTPRRYLLSVAALHASSLVAYLQAIPGVLAVIASGRYRRTRETVGDLDLLVTTRTRADIADQIANTRKLPSSQKILGRPNVASRIEA